MVELRGCTHLHSHMHYIRAIKDGTVKIVMNAVAKGKSKLKLRDTVDIYNQEKSKDGDSVARIQERVLSDAGDVSDMAQQGSCLFGAEVNTETEPEDFNMTLDKIRKQCREKKRKRRNHRDIERVSEVKVKQECSSLQTEDEGCDLEEPLSSWDTKFSKRRKRKQESKAKHGSNSTSSLSVEEVVLPLFCHVKSEPWEDSCSVSEAMDFIPTDPLLDCSKESKSPPNTELVEEVMHDSSKDTRLALYWSAEPNSPEMVAIEDPITSDPVVKALKDAPEEFDDEFEEFKDAPEEFNDAPEEFNDGIALEYQESCLYGSVSSEETELEVPQISETERVGCVKNSISSNTSSESGEVQANEESNDPKPYLDITITGSEIVKIEAPEILITDYSVLPIADFGVENTEIVWETEDIAKDDLPGATDILQLTNYCDSVPDDSTISVEEEDQLQERLQEPAASSGHVDEAGEHIASQIYKAPDEVTTDVEIDSTQQQKLHHQPEKLLSGRKALSPNSQAKLRKAMENPDSPEKKSKKPKVKLYFSGQTSHRILKAEGLDTVDRVEVIPNSKQAIQKTNNNNSRQYQRATNKLPRRDNNQGKKPQPFSTGCTSLQGCSQKAITFSQGQMRDFQFVAARLTKELKSMRQITKRCLLAESNTSNIPDCNLDEVKALIGNAEKTEESSKKWLSMIERDCNRFCKLMGMVKEDSPAATENIVQIQKKKKIKFADDAGGDLCHVKVFEMDLESES